MEIKEKWKQKDKINLSILVFFPTIHVYLATLEVYTKVEDSGSHRSWEICNRKFDWEKEKWTNKGNDKQQKTDSLLHNTTVIPNICTKYQNPRRSSSWEIFDTNFPMYYIGVKDRKKEKWKKKAKINLSILVSFPQYTSPLSRLPLSKKPRNLWWKFLLDR